MGCGVMRAVRGVAAALVAVAAPVAMPAAEDEAFVFCSFIRNGEDGLHLAWSADGTTWEALNEGRSFLTPVIGTREKLMRDPCIARGPDGMFHLVWTTGWWERGIGYASSPDLIHWSEQRELPVMAHEPTARNCWAPEILWDAKRGEFLIFWATTIPGRFPATAGSSEDDLNHRIYCTTTSDFATFTPTRLFFDPGFSVIDATIFRAQGRYALIIKDETRHPPKKHLRLAMADDAHGLFEKLSAPFSPEGLWVEGPTAIQTNDGFLVYYDAYTDERFGALRSTDLKTWEDVSAKISLPGEGTTHRMRHGTVFAVPRSVVGRLRDSPDAHEPAGSRKTANE